MLKRGHMRHLRLAALVLLAALCVLPARAADNPTRDQVTGVVLKFAKSWETGDLDAFVSTLDDGLVWAHPGGVLDKPGAIAFYKKWKTEWKDTRIYPTEFIVEGSRVVARYQFCATNIATGRREAEGTASIGVVKDGKLVSWMEFYDHSVGALQAEGKIPVDEGAEGYPYPKGAPNRW
jgi:ketosteroid isomerase-like protein